jgi:hypothetical protein
VRYVTGVRQYNELFRNIEFVNKGTKLCAFLQVPFKVHNSIMIALSHSQGSIEKSSKGVNVCFQQFVLVTFDTDSYGFKRLFKEIHIPL